MSLTIKDVAKVAKLARLELRDDETQKFANQLANILKYIEKLNEANTENIESFISKGSDENLMRQDDIEIKTTLCEEIIMNAPEKEGNFFKVKKVIE